MAILAIWAEKNVFFWVKNYFVERVTIYVENCEKNCKLIEKMVSNTKNKKLIPQLMTHETYVLLYRNLNYFVELGAIVTL